MKNIDRVIIVEHFSTAPSRIHFSSSWEKENTIKKKVDKTN